MGDVPYPTPSTGVDSDAWVSAVSAIRAECGWHVAPEGSETVVIVAGDGVLVLPTLRLVTVEAILDEDAQPVASWKRPRPNGVVRGPFRAGREYEVTMLHGFREWPPQLTTLTLALMRSEALAGMSQVTAGPFNYSMPSSSAGGPLADRARMLDPYRLPSLA